MTPDTLHAAHESGYLHGILVGVVLGLIFGALAMLALLSLAMAAGKEPPAPPLVDAVEDHPAIESDGRRVVVRGVLSFPITPRGSA